MKRRYPTADNLYKDNLQSMVTKHATQAQRDVPQVHSALKMIKELIAEEKAAKSPNGIKAAEDLDLFVRVNRLMRI